MITIEALKTILKEMKTIYPYESEKTLFRMSRDLHMCSETVVEIKTIDEKTGIEVIMSKNGAEITRKDGIDG